MLQALLIESISVTVSSRNEDRRCVPFGTNREDTRPAPNRDRCCRYRPFSDTFGSIGFAAGRWVIGNTAMPQLARFASDYVLHAPVLDPTELVGCFDYKQPTRLPQSEATYGDPSDSFLCLLPEHGLKLYRANQPVEVFVIDHAAKPLPN
jgi:uncharacterized protein (TIGR03435 family)